MPPKARDPNERFDEKYVIEGECWLWLGSDNGNGYPQFYLSQPKRKVGAHVYSYERFVGSVPEGCDVHHTCKQTMCVNPDHLVAQTRAEHNVETFGHHDRCSRGHEFTPENTYYVRVRQCRKCKAERQSRSDRTKRRQR